MSGAWAVSRNAVAPVHTFTAPEDGWLVNSHLVELRSELFVVDAQYTLPLAHEVVRYASRLKKPITRLYVTHYYPDHLLGAAAFSAPLFALDSVAEKVAQAGDRVAREEHEKIGDDILPVARKPDKRVAEGQETVDGVRIEHRSLKGAETDDALAMALPDAGVIIVQDLVYNRAHPFLAERHFDSWRGVLRQYRALPYESVFPGHGQPGGKTLYDAMIVYLDVAEEVLRTSRTAGEFKQRLLDRFPEHGCLKVLDHQLRFLFPAIEETGHA